ncbi:MAG: N-acetylmuramoyl-L-alanine amidase [Candidatus Hydrogenedentes bacterium]|nr:N-acetylmuramoyl-L-alanine amidase [Candidatus Hydrogenedentota bacterium]
MKKQAFFIPLLTILFVCFVQHPGRTQDSAYYSAQIGADMITIAAPLENLDNNAYVNLNSLMRQIDGVVSFDADLIQTNWNATTVNLQDRENQVRAAGSSFYLDAPVRRIGNAVFLSTRDVPLFFATAFNLSFTPVTQIDAPPSVELSPVEPDESVLEMPDSMLLESVEAAEAADALSDEEEGEEDSEGDAAEDALDEAELADETVDDELPPITAESLEWSALAQCKGRLLLDPGHGGQDIGATGGNDVLEKDISFAIAQRIQKSLEENTQINVQLTRDKDTDLSLENRRVIAQTAPADYFLSLHCGFSVTPRTQGTVLFTDYTTLPSDAVLSEELRKRYDKQQKTLEKASTIAFHLAQVLREITPSNTILVRNCPLILQREIEIPVILIELAYLSNIDSATLLRESDYQEEIATQLAKAIAVSLKQ